ncbi:hypothetical protein MOPEL_036_00120 [Mobilicoccus pelagius NBRC 104925]|uniref:Uncharacterized protein n=1 Tax=Mobilicoccus pelagius NBRC 104925 TaxID=1089455 RepID=H5UQP0_9MICO|nr:hypothetical protein MOPEL_036_00120 [Mobilicoccus pelagius NBRC 104925]
MPPGDDDEEGRWEEEHCGETEVVAHTEEGDEAVTLMDRRDAEIRRHPRRFTDSPSSVTVPRSGTCSPARTRNDVDVPEPLGPVTATGRGPRSQVTWASGVASP